MKILVVGSEGFIGSNLCRYFVEKGLQVYGADVVEPLAYAKYQHIKVSRLSAEWDDIFQLTNFNLCINAAGSGNVPYSISHPLIDFEANAGDVIQILDAIRKYNPLCNYLHISSAAVYGNPIVFPIKETDILQPVSPYGFHKLMSELICKEYTELFNLRTAVIRPFSVYGEGLRKQLFWDICQKIDNSVEGKITLFGTGDESRDFIYIDDFVELIYLITSKCEFNGNIYNAASGQETTIKQIAKLVMIEMPGVKINFSKGIRNGDPNNWRADITKIQALGFKPLISITEGLKRYLDWFKTMYSDEQSA